MEKELNEILCEIAKLDLKTYRPDEPNLFYMLGIEHNEVLICRLIAALIQPNGLHGLGTKPLEVFLEKIGITEFGNLDTAEVVLEEKIDNDRRVDIVIYLKNKENNEISRIIPFEVKIGSGDQPNQLYDYYYFYYNKYEKKIEKIYYLTPDGCPPSNNSILSKDEKDILDKKHFECISFKTHIHYFLNSIYDQLIEKDGNISNIINDFMEVVFRMDIDIDNKENLYKYINDMSNLNSDLNTRKLNSLLMILHYKDDLWNEIRYGFLKNSLEGQTPYILEKYENNDEFKDFDSHCLYVIKDNDTVIAYICIETNLYITRKTDSILKKNGWTEYKSKKYAWKYITKDNKAWGLKIVDLELLSQEIEWKKYLGE